MRQPVEDSPLVRSMSIAPDNVIRFIEPVEGNEAAIDLDFRTVPEQWEPIARIIETGQPALLGPFPLVQGGTGLAYREPVELPAEGYWGLVSTIIDADAFFALAGEAVGVDPSRIAVRTQGGHSPVWGAQEVFGADSVVLPTQPLGVAWEVGVRTESPDTRTVATLITAGVLTSIVIALIAYALVRSRQGRRELVHRLSMLSEQTPGLLFQLRVGPDISVALPLVGQRVVTLFDMTPEELRHDASALWERMALEDRARVTDSLRSSLAHCSPWHDRFRMTTADGQQRWFQADASPQSDAAGGVLLSGYLVDVTHEVEADEQLRISASVFDTTRDGVIIMDAQRLITDINPGFIAITGYTHDDVIGHPLSILGSDLNPGAVYDTLNASLTREGFWRGELIHRDRDGWVSAQAATVSAVTDSAGEFSHYVAILSGLGSMREDLVTGLPGRQVADDRLTQAVERARTAGTRVTLVVVGLDRFRDVNDALGHPIGDLILKESALRLREAVAEPQTVARLSGDEFTAILSEETTPEAVLGTASRIADSLAEPFHLAGREVRLTASIGIAVFPDDARDASALLNAASQALRAAKEAGRSRYRYFTPTMQEQAQERVRLTHDLYHAVRNGELQLALQPVVSLQSGRTMTAEALVRWEHPELGAIDPSRFIPLAEASGQITVIGDWVFGQVLDVLPRARDVDPDFTISFNLSPAEVLDPDDVHHRRLMLLRERGIPGSSLVAEITEGALLRASEAEQRNLLVYRDAGVGFAVDDFGTGYSSLPYLQSLDVDALKIDRSFVTGLKEQSDSRALCAAIVTMAHTLGLRVVAEGIEYERQRELLAAMGCDLGQGYLFSRPISPEELIARLESERSSA